MLVKSIYIWAILLAQIHLFAQNIVHINYDIKPLIGLTQLIGDGKLIPIEEDKSVFIGAFAELCILNTKSGEILKKFKDSVLDKAYGDLLEKYHKGEYSQYTDYLGLPTCQKHPYVYEDFKKVSENLYACDVICTIEKNDTKEMVYTYIVIYLDKDLNLIKIYEKEKYSGALLTASLGRFFTDQNNFYIKKGPGANNLVSDYVHFQKIDEKFNIVDDLAIPGCSVFNYCPSRYFVPFNIHGYLYFNNGENLFKVDSCFNIISTIKYKPKNSSHQEQLISNLVKIDDEHLAGLRIDLNQEGLAYFSTIFKSNVNMTKVKDIQKYDLIKYRINSIEAFEGKVYVLIYNRIKKEYFIKII